MEDVRYHEITDDDVGKVAVRWWSGRTEWVPNFLGHIVPQDVGKRAYLVGGVVQVENDGQRDQRVGKGRGVELMLGSTITSMT